jgi:hypothetical protein
MQLFPEFNSLPSKKKKHELKYVAQPKIVFDNKKLFTPQSKLLN